MDTEQTPTEPVERGERPSERSTGRRFRGAIAHYLGTAIVSGAIRPGERLTGEVANAEALDVSRSAYREAVQVLTAKGLVVSTALTDFTRRSQLAVRSTSMPRPAGVNV